LKFSQLCPGRQLHYGIFASKGLDLGMAASFAMTVPAQAIVGILIGAHERPTGVVEGINERSNHETLIGFIGPDKTGSPV
jgi:hypothetical protein